MILHTLITSQSVNANESNEWLDMSAFSHKRLLSQKAWQVTQYLMASACSQQTEIDPLFRHNIPRM